MSGPVIHFPTPEEDTAALKRFVEEQANLRAQAKIAATVGRIALDRLIDAMRHKTGQSYKLRELLWSLYNGKPADLSHTLNLDWSLKQDICLVIIGFGFEGHDVRFFYDAMRDDIAAAGLWDWFVDQSEVNR